MPAVRIEVMENDDVTDEIDEKNNPNCLQTALHRCFLRLGIRDQKWIDSISNLEGVTKETAVLESLQVAQ